MRRLKGDEYFARTILSLNIDLKKDKGGRVSTSQKEWQQALEMRGYKATIAKGYDEAVRVLEWYLD